VLGRESLSSYDSTRSAERAALYLVNCDSREKAGRNFGKFAWNSENSFLADWLTAHGTTGDEPLDAAGGRFDNKNHDGGKKRPKPEG